jgi:hypothetical protein
MIKTLKVWKSPVSVVAVSGNTKTGPVAATSVSQASCPTSCPLLGAGCYAEYVGMQPFTTRRLNSNPVTDALKIAKIEADLIDRLPGTRDLRVHVVGDCGDNAAAAGLVGSAMVRYERRGGFRSWTYTHSWKKVPFSAWNGARVMASVHCGADVAAAKAQGYMATAFAVPDRHASRKAYTVDGVKVVPCPAQLSSDIHCYVHGSRSRSCGICKGPAVTVAFQPDGLRKGQLNTS